MCLDATFELCLGKVKLKQELHIEKGEIAALMGASGAGKSLTLDCLAGLMQPSEGTITLGGTVLFSSKDSSNLPAQKRQVGYLFQGSALFSTLNVIQNVMAAAPRGTSKAEAQGAALAALSQCEAEELALRHPKSLSGGERQRVALARLIVQRPKLLLLDEPTSALDAHLRWQMQCLLRDLLPTFDCPVLYVTHDRNELMHLAKSVVVLEEGISSPKQTAASFFAHPQTVYAARLSGCKNIVRISCAAKSGQLCLVDFDQELALHDVPKDAQVMAVRAHDISVGEADGKPGLMLELLDCMDAPFSVWASFGNARSKERIYVALSKESATYATLELGRRYRLSLDTSKLMFFDGKNKRV